MQFTLLLEACSLPVLCLKHVVHLTTGSMQFTCSVLVACGSPVLLEACQAPGQLDQRLQGQQLLLLVQDTTLHHRHKLIKQLAAGRVLHNGGM